MSVGRSQEYAFRFQILYFVQATPIVLVQDSGNSHPKEAITMQTDRYNYSPIIRRKPFKWPNQARVALMVAPNIEFFHIDKIIPGAPNSLLPDVTGYALRDYGSRIGVFRMMEVLDRHGIRATVLLNADVCAHHPAIIEEGNRRGWEWLGHGRTNNIRINPYPPHEA